MTEPAILRAQLSDRRGRLKDAVATIGESAHLVGLLREVDAALERIDAGSYGLCDVCHDAIEADRLIADPLVRLCLDHLTEEQRFALESDLELAARVQGALLPGRDLRASGWEAHFIYEPAGAVSGDYCDWIQPSSRNGDVYFFLGDVSGKGVSASILMAHMQAILRAVVTEGLPLDRMVERANRVLCESTLPTSYATLVAGRATDAGGLEICNAGHCPPLLVQGGEVTPLRASGVPVGLFCSGRSAPRSVRMAPGDLLVLYTDGLTESANRAEEEYGLERLGRLLSGAAGLSPSAVTALCREDLGKFQAGARAADDLTIMAIRRAA
jgi:phosphoserine phosphatase RsbU/P